MTHRPEERGQATVELALLLPVIALLVLAVVQVAVVARAELLVVTAAREAARAAAVGDDPALAHRLPPDQTQVSRWNEGDLVVVRVRYHQPTDVPLVGALVGDVVHEAVVAMRRES